MNQEEEQYKWWLEGRTQLVVYLETIDFSVAYLR